MKSYSLSKPSITVKEKKAVMEVLDSDCLSLGPKTVEFEREFAAKIGTRYACAVSSGTAGLHLAVLAAGIQKGDEVITSPFSFVASANCLKYVGAIPVFSDIDPVTYNLDPAKIEKKITPKTKAILVVHIFGQTVDMDPILKIAKKHKLKIIEDACESIGATYKGKQAGTFGESAVFAFYPNKQMTTGEGGMIVSDNANIIKACRTLRNQGRTEDMQWLDHEVLGYNYRLDEMSSALGLAQLKRLDYLIAERQRIAKTYALYLQEHSDVLELPRVAKDNVHTWFVYVVRLKDRKPANRDKTIELLKKAGVSSKPYLPSIHLFSFYRKEYGYKEGDFPVSESVSNSSLALPLYAGLAKKDIKDIANRLIKILK